MINKVVGYGGYKSYSECPYPTVKQGKELQKTNQVWASTKRQIDAINPIENFNHYHSNYKKNHLENTNPKDYHPEHVPKGGSSTLNFAGTSLVKPYDQVEAEKDGQPLYRSGFDLLKTGTQHWKSNYQGSICEPPKQCLKEGSSKPRISSSNPKGAGYVDQELSKALSYKNRPYVNQIKTGVTEYKFNYGQRIGSHPKEILNETSYKQPLIDNPLKHGTNQHWTQIPGYMGFKSSEIPFGELKDKIDERKRVDKGDRKLQLGQNYHVNIPGYGGYKPTINVGNSGIRQSCFQYHK